MENQPIKKQRSYHSHFPLFFTLYTLFCLSIVGTGLYLLWGFLAQYDQNAPDQIAAAAAATIENGDYSLIQSSEQLQPSRFADANRIQKWVESYLKEKEVSSRRSTKTSNQYLLSANGEDFASFTLIPEGEPNLYGMQPHQITQVKTFIPFLTDFQIEAPAQAVVTVNGVTLLPEEQIPTEQEFSAYANLPEPQTAPQKVTYQLDSLAGIPEISAQMPNGICEISAKGKKAIITAKADPSLIEILTPLASESAQLYARFITQDASRNQLSPYLLKGTEFYQKLSEFYNGWYITHDSYQFGEVKIDDFQAYSSQHISCDVSFDYQIRRGSKTYDFPSAYTLYFILTEDEWKVANILTR